MIRKNPCHDPLAGCYSFPAEPLTEGSKRLVADLSKRVTWGRPLKGTESPEEAYARGWADAVAKYEKDRQNNKLWWESRLTP